MSRYRDEAKQRINGKSKPAVPTSPRPFTFHPTTAQRQALAEYAITMSEVLLRLEFWVHMGHRITIGHSDRGEGLYAVIRDGTESWENAQAVFVYHNDLGKALLGLHYFLTEVAPEFPRLPAGTAEFVNDW